MKGRTEKHHVSHSQPVISDLLHFPDFRVVWPTLLPLCKGPGKMTLFVQSEQLAESKDFKSPMAFQRLIVLGCNSGELISRKTH